MRLYLQSLLETGIVQTTVGGLDAGTVVVVAVFISSHLVEGIPDKFSFGELMILILVLLLVLLIVLLLVVF